MKMFKEEIRTAIWVYEYCFNGLDKISGADVVVKNIRESRGFNGGLVILADIIIFGEDGRKECFKDCEYPFDLLFSRRTDNIPKRRVK